MTSGALIVDRPAPRRPVPAQTVHECAAGVGPHRIYPDGMGGTASRTIRVLLASAVGAVTLLGLTPQARACACGAVVADEPVAKEAAFVWFDGSTEQIDMVLGLQGSVQDAAWIMPVPNHTEVSIGDQKALTQSATDALPEYRTKRVVRLKSLLFGSDSSGSAAGPTQGARPESKPVEVEKVSTVGPFQVTQLTGTDGSAVAQWLTAHGYPSKPQLAPTFTQYLKQGWRIDAVKLLPVDAGTSLPATWPALRMSFPASGIVYPLVLSKYARIDQEVTLYLAAPHRMEVLAEPAPNTPLRVDFAGRVPASHAGRTESLGEQLDGQPSYYLTVFSRTLTPADITQDVTFRQAPNDEPYRQVYWNYEYVDIPVEPIILLVAAFAVVVALAMRQRSRR